MNPVNLLAVKIYTAFLPFTLSCLTREPFYFDDTERRFCNGYMVTSLCFPTGGSCLLPPMLYRWGNWLGVELLRGTRQKDQERRTRATFDSKNLITIVDLVKPLSGESAVKKRATVGELTEKFKAVLWRAVLFLATVICLEEFHLLLPGSINREVHLYNSNQLHHYYY